MLRIARNLAIVLGAVGSSIALIYFSIPISSTDQKTFDVILVPASPANSDGSITPIGQSLVLEGIRQYRAGVAPRLLITGGAAKNQFVEAQVMAHFAASQGLPSSAILTEEQSIDTIQKIYYSARILHARGWDSALVIGLPSQIRFAAMILRYYPIAWRMQAAPWPQEMGLQAQLESWSAEALRTSYARIVGFPGSQQFVPRARLTPHQL